MDSIIDTAELAKMLEAPDLVVVDCRFELLDPAAGYSRYREGHVPGARYASLDDDLAAQRGPGDGRHPLPAPAALAATFERLGISRTSRVVAYDDVGGAFAARLWWSLRWLGHREAAVLDGGIQSWIAAGEPLETALPDVVPGRFELGPVAADAVVETEALETLLSGGAVLLDARTPDRFAGRAEPIDAVAGHVPGARNLPFGELLGENGRFLEPARLRERFAAVLGPRRGAEVVTMCGSGVTACHLLLAMERAGLGTGRLYAGSWSAWITDSGRPVASGTD